jgi:hypothetical protein
MNKKSKNNNEMILRMEFINDITKLRRLVQCLNNKYVLHQGARTIFFCLLGSVEKLVFWIGVFIMHAQMQEVRYWTSASNWVALHSEDLQIKQASYFVTLNILNNLSALKTDIPNESSVRYSPQMTSNKLPQMTTQSKMLNDERK